VVNFTHLQIYPTHLPIYPTHLPIYPHGKSPALNELEVGMVPKQASTLRLGKYSLHPIRNRTKILLLSNL